SRWSLSVIRWWERKTDYVNLTRTSSRRVFGGEQLRIGHRQLLAHGRAHVREHGGAERLGVGITAADPRTKLLGARDQGGAELRRARRGRRFTDQFVEPSPLADQLCRFELELARRDRQHVGGDARVELGRALQGVDGVLLEKAAHGVEQLRDGRTVLHGRRGTPTIATSQSRFGVRWLATALECGSLLPLWGGRGTAVDSFFFPPLHSHPKAVASCRTPKLRCLGG